MTDVLACCLAILAPAVASALSLRPPGDPVAWFLSAPAQRGAESLFHRVGGGDEEAGRRWRVDLSGVPARTSSATERYRRGQARRGLAAGDLLRACAARPARPPAGTGEVPDRPPVTRATSPGRDTGGTRWVRRCPDAGEAAEECG